MRSKARNKRNDSGEISGLEQTPDRTPKFLESSSGGGGGSSNQEKNGIQMKGGGGFIFSRPKDGKEDRLLESENHDQQRR